MVNHSDNAKAVLSKVKLFILDMDGTIYLQDELFDFTKPFLKTLEDFGLDYIFFTNNSSKSTSGYIAKLAKMGITVNRSKMLSSVQVIISYLKASRSGKRLWVAGNGELLAEFSQEGLNPQDEDPEIIILGFDTTITYEKLRFMHERITAGAEYLIIHPDLVCPVKGGFIPDCGAMSKVITATTGVTPEFFGKPSRKTVDYILTQIGYREEDLCFIGDRIYTDIAVANGTGASSVLVLSGESKLKDLERYEGITPNLIVDDLSDLTLLLNESRRYL